MSTFFFCFDETTTGRVGVLRKQDASNESISMGLADKPLPRTAFSCRFTSGLFGRSAVDDKDEGDRLTSTDTSEMSSSKLDCDAVETFLHRLPWVTRLPSPDSTPILAETSWVAVVRLALVKSNRFGLAGRFIRFDLLHGHTIWQLASACHGTRV